MKIVYKLVIYQNPNLWFHPPIVLLSSSYQSRINPVSIPYRFRINPVLFPYQSRIGIRKQYGNNTGAIRK